MKESSINLSKVEKKFLISLIDDGSKSDTAIAKEIGVSKATAGRIRKKLEGSKVIEDYIPILNLKQFDVDMFVIFSFKWDAFANKKLTNEFFSKLEADPNVIFLANGQGSDGSTTVLFLGFKDIEDYNNYLRHLNATYGKNISQNLTLISPSSEIRKQDYTHIILKMLKTSENGKKI